MLLIAVASLSLALGPPPASVVSRRAVLLAPAALLAAAPRPSVAADSLTETYTDTRYGVQFGLPAGFKPQAQELADGRRLVTATSPSDDSTNIFIAFTPVRPDYVSLGSFGNIDYVASTIIPQCNGGDCKLAAGDPIEGKMVSQDTIKGSYVYDYTIEQKGGPKRHLRSLFAIKADPIKDGASSILVSLTAQCLEASHKDLAPMFKAVMESYKDA